MTKKVLKIFALAMSFMIVATLAVYAVGCKNETTQNFEEREVGNFVVQFYKDYCRIKGTSEQGNKQRFLVVPAYIDGVRVESFGAYNSFHEVNMLQTDLYPPTIESNALEKIYFESPINSYPTLSAWESHPNLQKVMYPAKETFRGGFDGSNIYYPRKIYEAQINDLAKNPANVSYYYNYENAENDGYYWIDDCDYDGKIEFIPENPVREGYTFGGWYKETECINEWNFEVDTLPEQITETNEERREKVIYQETILYAKWIED